MSAKTIEDTKERVKGWYNPEITDEKLGDYLSLARQLCYPKEVIDAIRHSKTEIECENILKSARKRY